MARSVLTPARGDHRGMVVVAFLAPLVVYVWVVANEPDSYRQWKAFAIASPFLVLAGGVFLASVADLARPYSRARPIIAAAIVLAVTAWVGFAAVKSWDPSSGITSCQWSDCPIGDDVRSHYAILVADAGPGPVGVALEAGWASMTAAYFLWGRPTSMRSVSYWPVTDVPVTKTLTPAGWSE